MRGTSFLPAKRLILSYIWDWIVIAVLVGIGAAFNFNTPYKRPFSLVDLSISFPYVAHEKITTWLLVVVSVAAPAVIILLVCLIFVPGPTISRGTPKSLIWRRKFWEWNTGWMGLALSLALAFFFTQGMKNLFGKPRPDLLARCQPDMSEAGIARNIVGGFATSLDPKWVLVGAGICQQSDTSLLNDGFRSFPSGHSSTSWSGLFYLALFLCSKFAIGIPFLPAKPYSQDRLNGLDCYTGSDEDSILPLHEIHGQHASGNNGMDSHDITNTSSLIPARNQAAAPPNYLLALPLVPICTAIYITATRFNQFFHHGFDIISGSLIGILAAWFAFRWYHLPLSQGSGWSWGARSRDRAFAIGVGVPGYVGTEGWASKKKDRTSTKGKRVLGPGLDENEEAVKRAGGSSQTEGAM